LREQDLNTDYGWLTVVAFDWLPSAPTALSGLPGKRWADDERAYVKADGELTLGGEPVYGETSASVAEAGSLSWLLHGDRLAELVLRSGRYAVRAPGRREPRIGRDLRHRGHAGTAVLVPEPGVGLAVRRLLRPALR